jgi:hypothetical protein
MGRVIDLPTDAMVATIRRAGLRAVDGMPFHFKWTSPTGVRTKEIRYGVDEQHEAGWIAVGRKLGGLGNLLAVWYSPRFNDPITALAHAEIESWGE